MITSGIYKITNIYNKKIYIGCSIDIYNRWDIHLKDLKRNKHHSITLQRSWKKHGEQSFTFEILETVEYLESETDLEFKQRLVNKEQFYLDTLLFANENNNKFNKLGYNICRKAGSPLGVKRSLETRRKLSKALTGRKVDREVVKKIVETRRKNGYKHTSSTIEKLKGRVMSLEARQKISSSLKGKPKSEEHKRKLSEARRKVKRNKHSEETKIKMSIAAKGKVKSIEHRKKISQTLKGNTPWNKGLKTKKIFDQKAL